MSTANPGLGILASIVAQLEHVVRGPGQPCYVASSSAA